MEHGVRPHDDVGLDPRGRRVDDRDPGGHQLVVLPISQNGRHFCELLPTVHPQDFPGVREADGFDREPPTAINSDEVRKIVLPLRVCRPDLSQGVEKRREVERVDAAVDFRDGPLVGGRVLVLDDRRNRAIFAHDAAVAVGLLDRRRQDRGGRATADVVSRRARWTVAARSSGTSPDSSRTVPRLPSQERLGLKKRVPGSELRFLHSQVNVGLPGEVLSQLFGLMTNNDDDRGRAPATPPSPPRGR